MENPAVAFPSRALHAIPGTRGEGLVISTYILYSELFCFLSYPLCRWYIYQGQELCLKYCLCLPLARDHSFLISALLTFWVSSFFIVGAVTGIVECLAFARCQWHQSPVLTIKSGLCLLPNMPSEANLFYVTTTAMDLALRKYSSVDHSDGACSVSIMCPLIWTPLFFLLPCCICEGKILF